MKTQLNYGNWVRKKNLVVLGVCTLGAGALIFIPLGFFYCLSMTILFAIMFASFLFPLYAYAMFSQKGGRLQEKVYNLIIRSLGAEVKGRILDIGSGNGVLAVKLAQQHSEAEVVGIDYWGKDWEYSKGVCEQNARAAQVENRVSFYKGDAAALDFAAASFDGAVSNLTFHEVKSVADKKAVLQEALRVVKPGGTFAFVDYFYAAQYYGKTPEFQAFLSGMQLAQFECKPLRDMLAIPLLLRHPKILGRVGIIFGRKKDHREDIILKDGIENMNFVKVTEMLTKSYWCSGIKIDEVEKGAHNSALVTGAFLKDQTQIGYARVISDKTRFAYILDVYVDEKYRKTGIGQQMIKYILCHNDLKDVYQWLLKTKDAHGVYAKMGFSPLSCPSIWMEIRKERPGR